jgi:hypothetical protein
VVDEENCELIVDEETLWDVKPTVLELLKVTVEVPLELVFEEETEPVVTEKPVSVELADVIIGVVEKNTVDLETLVLDDWEAGVAVWIVDSVVVWLVLLSEDEVIFVELALLVKGTFVEVEDGALKLERKEL